MTNVKKLQCANPKKLAPLECTNPYLPNTLRTKGQLAALDLVPIYMGAWSTMNDWTKCQFCKDVICNPKNGGNKKWCDSVCPAYCRNKDINLNPLYERPFPYTPVCNEEECYRWKKVPHKNDDLIGLNKKAKRRNV